jgi:hypothetical protein
MPVAAHQSRTELRFAISHDLAAHLRAWAVSIDTLVFREQLASGSFRGRWRVDAATLAIMRNMEAHGEVMPYYGTGGSRGACVYLFRPSPSGCTVRVEHTITGDSVAGDHVPTAAPGPIRRMSLIGYAERLLGQGKAQPAHALHDQIYMIAGREHKALRAWPGWERRAALRGRYIYRFGQVSLGPTGYTASVEDTARGEVVDVTDYNSW